MMSPSLQITDALVARCAETAKRTAALLESQQNAEGYWCAQLTADTTLESDWVLLQLWLSPPEPGGPWAPSNRAQIDKAARSILRRQLADGGFNIYPDGPSDVSASVKAYFALKLAGFDPASECLARLRERILALGGLQAVNSYTKINLSLFGLYPRCATPAIPPEMILWGNLIYHMSSWSRAILMPLAIVYATGQRIGQCRPDSRLKRFKRRVCPFACRATARLPGIAFSLAWTRFFVFGRSSAHGRSGRRRSQR